MQADRWRQIDEIFHSALQVEESRRAAFLDEACSGDLALRRDLDRLLLRHRQAESFLESPALEVAAEALAPNVGESGELAAALLGETISHYRILSRIGTGGMGVVYKAEDIRLGRAVALKFLPQNLARDARALQRFEREARAASSLKHSNICTIYEVEEHDGQPVIVMELLEGQSLKERIKEGPAPTAELLDFGIQICKALEAAHEMGIIHRDIKPANIFIIGNGQLKILDFGLAKVIPTPEREDEESLTLEGIIAGTTAYMSPEQASGEEVDARSDLFSLGVTLYELATTKQPFARKNTVQTIDAILNVRSPAAASLNPALPAALDKIIAKLLEKDRARRYQSASEIRADLQSLKSGATNGLAKHWRLMIAAAAALVALSAASYFYFHRAPVLTGKDTIVLAEFINRTGDPVFDGTLRQGLAVQLEQSPFLSVVSDGRIQKTLRLMGQPADAQLTPDLAREICERTASAAVLEGSVASLGSQYVLGLRARNCRTGDVLDEQQAPAARKEDVLSALSQIASKFRARVGESLATVEQHSTPLAEATTPSLEALKAFSMGREMGVSKGPPTALPFFKRATEIDPQFALAHAWLGLTYSNIGELGQAMESIGTAWQLRDRSSDQEKFFIAFSYDKMVTGNLEKAQQTCELWAQTYPRDPAPHAFLAGGVLLGLGKFERSGEEGRKALDLDPDNAFTYLNLASSYVYRNRPAEGLATLQRASERRLDIPELLALRYQIAFLQNDNAEMERVAALGREKSGMEDWMCDLEASVLAHSGRLREARGKSRRALDLAQEAGHRERAAQHEAEAAVREILFGNAPEARRSAASALSLSNGREAEYGAALALAFSGDSSRSQTLVDDLEKRFPEDTLVRFSYLPALRALMTLNRREPAKAIELLQAAASYELGWQGFASVGFVGSLYPIYVRGEAYLAARQGAEAAREFQKILDHRGIVCSDPIGALARLQLGRAFALSGDKRKAKAAYEDFLTLWKDADPDIPILKKARMEYARGY